MNSGVGLFFKFCVWFLSHLGDVVNTLLEGEHDDFLQDGYGLLTGWTDTGQSELQQGYKRCSYLGVVILPCQTQVMS